MVGSSGGQSSRWLLRDYLFVVIGIVALCLAFGAIIFGGAAWHHVAEIERDLDSETTKIRQERETEVERLRNQLDYQRLMLDTYETWMHNTRERMIAFGLQAAPIPDPPDSEEE